ncbi:bacillithiol biosynthesis cysteine-adding enzyme BshC [Rhodothermus bifroesti]|jgi:bacillithiol biosynthesis cysteine-adding enzyme BshC|uniref:Putative cysteine ligase BshC n=1 Tax=Rhodothermus marinus TaxID=29549 RepID=A0A7V2AZS8_RHOMR|nr:bacillithiol biosynthesis cysteine-adding enzyme BshC [Rhodothermus bifroesti]GBD01482.1 Putative cysteine ligase BshC [bacterium HR18]
MTAALRIQQIDRLPLPTLRKLSKLFVTYATDYALLDAFYAGDYRSPSVRRALAKRVAQHPRQRDVLVRVLLEQNTRWGLDAATQANIEALRLPDSVAVVSGQQVGLFGGPLFTLYKVLTLCRLAQALAEELERPVIPVFWLAGEDHDYEEVAALTVLKGAEPVTLRLELPLPGYAGAVGRLPLPASVRDLLAALEALLPATAFREPLMALLNETYQPGVTLQDAFARLLKRWLPGSGLVLIDPDDARLKALARPLFAQELEDWQTAQAHLEHVSRSLEHAYHVQVRTQPTNLFLLEDHQRLALDAFGEGFRLRGTDRQLSRQEALSLLEASPERFSPGVLLRPLYQDWLLPTLVYVAGPSETAYWAQLKPLYAWANVPMPLVFPRTMALLVEPRVAQLLERYKLRPEMLQHDPDHLFHELVRQQLDGELEAAFKAAQQQLDDMVARLRPVVERIEPTLGPATEALGAALRHELDRFEGRVLKAAKQREATLHNQIARLHASLFPNGVLQERVFSPVYFLSKYGLGLIEALYNDWPLDPANLHIVYL